MRGALAAAMFLCCCAGPAAAGSFSASAKGTTAADFLELGVGGRAMGMGGAFTAVADDASALYWNPAGLVNTEKRAVTLMHAAYLDSSYFDYGAFAQSLGEAGAVGFGFQYLNSGSLTETDANFNAMGSFSPYDLAVSAGYAHKLGDDGAAVGISPKYIRSTIINTAQTVAVDVGVLSPEYLDKKLRLALTASNLAGTLKYAQTQENLPMTYKAGGSYRITDRWLASLDLGLPRDNGPFVAAGTEYVLSFGDAWSLAGRMGFDSQTIDDITGFSGLSMGLGFLSRSWSLDYAFVPYGGVGIANRFSVSAKF